MPRQRPDCARLHLPDASLGGCIFVAAERDTRGQSLRDEERFNYFPATPFSMISWVFQGSLHLVDDPGAGGQPTLGAALPRVVFSGPHRGPSASWSPGPIHALSIAMTPDAALDLFGISAEQVVDTVIALDEVASGPIVDRLVAVEPIDGGSAFPTIESILAEAWSDVRAGQHLASVRRWTQSVAMKAAFSRAGLGARQAQRRIRVRTGQSQRDLERYARLEDTIAQAVARPPGVRLDLADLAASAGYADQSHMGREVRRATGVSPARLEALIENEEGFWFYRLLWSHVRR